MSPPFVFFANSNGLLIKHDLLDVFGARLARTLPAAHGVSLVHGITKDNRSGYLVGDLSKRAYIGHNFLKANTVQKTLIPFFPDSAPALPLTITRFGG
jgi:hypothetical protein